MENDTIIAGEAERTGSIAREVSFQTSAVRDKRRTPRTRSRKGGPPKPKESQTARRAYPLTPALTLELIQTHAAGWQQHGHAISIENLHSKGRKAFAIVYNDAWWCKNCGSAIEGDPQPTCPLCGEDYASSEAQPTI